MKNKAEKLRSVYRSIENTNISNWLIKGEPVKKVSDYDVNAVFKYLTSPNSKTANNLDTQIIIVLQDWANQASARKFFSNPESDVLRYGYDPAIKTNKKIRDLLVEFFSDELMLNSNDLKDASLKSIFSKIYITNIFQFIKPGSMSSYVPQKYVNQCAEFTKQEINIIKPKIVICLGSQAYSGLTKSKREHTYIDGVLFFHQYHPAAYVSKRKMSESWLKMKGVMNNI